jgi:FMN phosphatase YigB (HAD superfamily)
MKTLLADYTFELFSLENNPNKIDPEYYKLLCKHLRIGAQHMLFFDHKQEDIDAATTFGLSQSLLHTSNKETIAWLE